MSTVSSSPVRIVIGTWDRLREHATSVRHEVFVLEQNVPTEIELGDEDAVSVHAVAYDLEDRPVGTGRLLLDGHIGRMAVRKSVRGTGVGGRVLDALIEQGHGEGEGHRMLVLHAQTHAKAFYEAHGFRADGDEFVEAGIPHVVMVRELTRTP
ncbi:GNAT family N-acetyltransferase [Bordetella holmesii]|uniref:FR47-like protein n=2 Tax=Bordetella holmesii TaxID=35814 RepID=A0A158M8X6_9BORD|nr:GNAT family N-acetyltransferase [Bordetella holmesii]AHV92931.1 acetyltransferase family protein [Bordetella holmesii ATCC 51541]AIT27308.1 acetyltransferase family protein [Bordetella holmesii 44057]EWM41938.1 acetyltransferase family protein [Bordetella holmesii 41130]EWM47894.1 acetyltransferase family protein [Bordetella holmesii 35009]EWM52055.1 acetyltransferase family protein [Bordetella holmesii 70147]